ncbi:MAG: hypothetical protein WBA39_10625, partial [Rivularia sp. (in: cyanobacteria)]
MFNFGNFGNFGNSRNTRKSLLSLALISVTISFTSLSSSVKPASGQIIGEQSTNWITSIWRRKPKSPRGARGGNNLSQVCPIAPGLVDTYIVWNDRPLFLWQYSGENKQVELIIRESGSQQNLWTKTVNLTDEKAFYEAQKALEPGKLYMWKLSGTSASGLFKIMPEDERKNIHQQLQALEKQLKNTRNYSEEIALKKANLFLNYEIKHTLENKTYNAWSDALLALYQVEKPSQSFVNNR